MFGLETLDVLIGLITVYLTFSLAVTAIVEIIGSLAGVRSRNLELACWELFSGTLTNGKNFVDAFYEHPLIQALSKGESKPSYIPKDVVARVVTALITEKNVAATIGNAIDGLPGDAADGGVKGKLRSIFAEVKGDEIQFEKAVGERFQALRDDLVHGGRSGDLAFVNTVLSDQRVVQVANGPDGQPKAVPPDLFGTVVKEWVMARQAASGLIGAINDMPPGDPNSPNRIKGLLKTLATEANGDVEKFRLAVETHFDAVMDRASGWVKRHQQGWAIAVSAILVLCANVDTVAIATKLATDKDARTKTVEFAQNQLTDAQVKEQTGEQAAKTPVANPPDAMATVDNADLLKKAREESVKAKDEYDKDMTTLKAAGLPLGWHGYSTCICDWFDKPSDLFSKLAGLILSTFAISLGAPFWFDMLQKIIQIRSSGITPEEKKDKEDKLKASLTTGK